MNNPQGISDNNHLTPTPPPPKNVVVRSHYSFGGRTIKVIKDSNFVRFLKILWHGIRDLFKYVFTACIPGRKNFGKAFNDIQHMRNLRQKESELKKKKIEKFPSSPRQSQVLDFGKPEDTDAKKQERFKDSPELQHFHHLGEKIGHDFGEAIYAQYGKSHEGKIDEIAKQFSQIFTQNAFLNDCSDMMQKEVQSLIHDQYKKRAKQLARSEPIDEQQRQYLTSDLNKDQFKAQLLEALKNEINPEKNQDQIISDVLKLLLSSEDNRDLLKNPDVNIGYEMAIGILTFYKLQNWFVELKKASEDFPQKIKNFIVNSCQAFGEHFSGFIADLIQNLDYTKSFDDLSKDILEHLHHFSVAEQKMKKHKQLLHDAANSTKPIEKDDNGIVVDFREEAKKELEEMDKDISKWETKYVTQYLREIDTPDLVKSLLDPDKVDAERFAEEQNILSEKINDIVKLFFNSTPFVQQVFKNFTFPPELQQLIKDQFSIIDNENNTKAIGEFNLFIKTLNKSIYHLINSITTPFLQFQIKGIANQKLREFSSENQLDVFLGQQILPFVYEKLLASFAKEIFKKEYKDPKFQLALENIRSSSKITEKGGVETPEGTLRQLSKLLYEETYRKENAKNFSLEKDKITEEDFFQNIKIDLREIIGYVIVKEVPEIVKLDELNDNLKNYFNEKTNQTLDQFDNLLEDILDLGEFNVKMGKSTASNIVNQKLHNALFDLRVSHKNLVTKGILILEENVGSAEKIQQLLSAQSKPREHKNEKTESRLSIALKNLQEILKKSKNITEENSEKLTRLSVEVKNYYIRFNTNNMDPLELRQKLEELSNEAEQIHTSLSKEEKADIKTSETKLFKRISNAHQRVEQLENKLILTNQIERISGLAYDFILYEPQPKATNNIFSKFKKFVKGTVNSAKAGVIKTFIGNDPKILNNTIRNIYHKIIKHPTYHRTLAHKISETVIKALQASEKKILEKNQADEFQDLIQTENQAFNSEIEDYDLLSSDDESEDSL